MPGALCNAKAREVSGSRATGIDSYRWPLSFVDIPQLRMVQGSCRVNIKPGALGNGHPPAWELKSLAILLQPAILAHIESLITGDEVFAAESRAGPQGLRPRHLRGDRVRPRMSTTYVGSVHALEEVSTALLMTLEGQDA